MIYTSYFAKYRGENGISVATSQPKGCSYPTFHQLVPDRSLVWAYKNGEVTEEEYTKMYNRQLDELDVHEIAQSLDEMVLLCWEGNEKFCHRHLISDWFNNHGIPCKEQHLVEIYFEPTIIPETCLYCKFSELLLGDSYSFRCTNKKSKHFSKKTKYPQRSKCSRWEEKF